MQLMQLKAQEPSVIDFVFKPGSSEVSRREKGNFASVLESCTSDSSNPSLPSVQDKKEEAPVDSSEPKGSFKPGDLSGDATGETGDEKISPEIALQMGMLLEMPCLPVQQGMDQSQLTGSLSVESGEKGSVTAQLVSLLQQMQPEGASAGGETGSLKGTSADSAASPEVQSVLPEALAVSSEDTFSSLVQLAVNETASDSADEAQAIKAKGQDTQNLSQVPEDSSLKDGGITVKSGPAGKDDSGRQRENPGGNMASLLKGETSQEEGQVQASPGGGEPKGNSQMSKPQFFAGSIQEKDPGPGIGTVQVGTAANAAAENVSQPQAESFIGRLAKVLQTQMLSKSELLNRNGVAEIKLELKPEYLGKLFVHLAMENGRVNARFLVENQQVRCLLENNMSYLKQCLADQGISWQDASVDVGGSGSGWFYEDEGSSQNSHGTGRWDDGKTGYGDEGSAEYLPVMENKGRYSSISYLA